MRTAIDTGGTFTDCVFLENGELRVLKVFSTPRDPAQAVLNALEKILPAGGVEVRHGTTLGTNAMLERRGARVAFVTTAGCEDTIAIGRQTRAALYDWFAPVPACLVPSELRFGVDERVSAEGKILRAPSDGELQSLAQAIRENGAEAVAVSLLFSFANPETERRLEAALRELKIPVSVSHRILPEFREYERGSTTVVNAYLAPRMREYLLHLEERVRAEHGGAGVDVMQSSGGIVSARLAAEEPVRTVLSGPAGGVIGACRVAAWAGFDRIIGLDMGGTSTDVFLSDATRGGVQRTRESVVAGVPVSVPMLEIHTVGAGGGSIARFDEGGMLRVGPESAGADPGPICFGRGVDSAMRATVTDANLLLGRLDAESFLGGSVPLHRDRAGKLLLVPAMPGALSALGILLADVVRDHARTVMLAEDAIESLTPMFRELEEHGQKEFAMEGLSGSAEYSLDVRYAGQGYELNVPWVAGAPADSIAAFHDLHRRRYGFCNHEKRVQIVNLRLRMKAETEPYVPQRRELRAGTGREACYAEREVCFDGKFVPSPFYRREGLVPGDVIHGPAMITEYTSATVLPADCSAAVDGFGNLVITIGEGA